MRDPATIIDRATHLYRLRSRGHPPRSAIRPPGSFPVTIAGTSGTLTQTASITLVVNGAPWRPEDDSGGVMP